MTASKPIVFDIDVDGVVHRIKAAPSYLLTESLYFELVSCDSYLYLLYYTEHYIQAYRVHERLTLVYSLYDAFNALWTPSDDYPIGPLLTTIKGLRLWVTRYGRVTLEAL